MRKYTATFSIAMIVTGLVLFLFINLTGCGETRDVEARIAEAYSASDQMRSQADIADAEAEAEEARSEATRALAQAQAQIAQAQSVAQIVGVMANVQLNAQNNEHQLAITYANGQVIEAHLNGSSLRYIAEHTYRTQDRIIKWSLWLIAVGAVAYVVSRGIAHSVPDAACKLCPIRNKYNAIMGIGEIETREGKWRT
jgi:hypothetical protein